MDRIVFSTDGLAPGLDDRARLSAWRDFLAGACSPLEVSCRSDRPFSQRMDAMCFDGAAVMRLAGTMDRTWWTRGTDAGRPPDFFLCLNRGPGPMALAQLDRQAELDRETAVLASCTEFHDIQIKGCNNLCLVVVPQARLRALVAGAEDFLARPLQGDNAALRHLRRYVDILSAPDGIEDDPPLVAHVATTLVDLVALALGAGREAGEIARMRGLRAARLREIVADIRASFADPAFSPHRVAGRVGVTTRYVQDLLQQTGLSFTDRVAELRLQRVRAMLANPRHDHLRINEIATASGFNEIPHFNRLFRRRFGATPTQFRSVRGVRPGT